MLVSRRATLVLSAWFHAYSILIVIPNFIAIFVTNNLVTGNVFGKCLGRVSLCEMA